jgi:hypothetical protein
MLEPSGMGFLSLTEFTTMTEFTLIRTGKTPLAFSGKLMGEADSSERQGPLQNRWHEVRVYQTAGGRWVGEVVFRTRWQGEHDRYTAEVANTPAELIQLLTAYDPTSEWEGYPDRPEYAERQARTQAAIRAGYERAISEAFADIEELVERIA